MKNENMKNENILWRFSPRHCRSCDGLLPSWLVDEGALLPVKDKQIESSQGNNEKVTQENHEAKTSELSEIRFTWGKAINSFLPYCCHMSCLLRPGFAGMKLVPGARTVKIYQVFLSVLWKLLSCKKLTWMPCSDKSCCLARRWTTSRRVLSMTGRVRHWGTELSSIWGNRDW